MSSTEDRPSDHEHTTEELVGDAEIARRAIDVLDRLAPLTDQSDVARLGRLGVLRAMLEEIADGEPAPQGHEVRPGDDQVDQTSAPTGAEVPPHVLDQVAEIRGRVDRFHGMLAESIRAQRTEPAGSLFAGVDGDPGDWPVYPRGIPREVEMAVHVIVGAAWSLLEPYRTADGPSEANNEIAAQLLLFLHSVQPTEAEIVVDGLSRMLEGAKVVAAEYGPDGNDWRSWGLTRLERRRVAPAEH